MSQPVRDSLQCANGVKSQWHSIWIALFPHAQPAQHMYITNHGAHTQQCHGCWAAVVSFHEHLT